MFPQMVSRIPEGRHGEAAVSHFDVPDFYARYTMGMREYVPAGRYARLHVGGRLVMSDTLMERESNREVLRHVRGDVLIGGLGLGMILDPILAKEEVRSVLVIEKSADVAALIGPHFRGPKLRVVVGDVFDRPVPVTARFSVIYFDIWPDICEDHIAGINRLHRLYRRHLDRGDPGAWMGSWKHSELKRLRRRGRRFCSYR